MYSLVITLHLLSCIDMISNQLTGATIPHGMVKVGMDTDSPGNVRLVCYAAGYQLTI